MSAPTLVPGANSPPGQDLTTPTHSMPLTSAISAHSPLRICSSAWLRPNALTWITAWPAFGSGSGISRMTSTSGPPKPVLRIARMITSLAVLLQCLALGCNALQQIAPGVIELLGSFTLELNGKRVDVDARPAEAVQHLLTVPAIGRHQVADPTVIGECPQRRLGHRGDR